MIRWTWRNLILFFFVAAYFTLLFVPIFLAVNACKNTGLQSQACASWLQGAGSVMALLITIGVAVAQAKDTDRRMREERRPYLDGDVFINSGNSTIGINVSNKGLGPAIIDDVTVAFDGKTIDRKATDLWDEVCKQIGIFGLMSCREFSPGTAAISSGETVRLFSWEPTDAKNISVDTLRKVHKIRVTMRVRSVYGDRYSCVISGEDHRPVHAATHVET